MTEAFPLSPSAERALRILESHGHEAYVVGGCVRDFCMNNRPMILISPPPQSRRR